MSGKGRVSLLNDDCTLEGEFVNGKLHGPVRGLTTQGNSNSVTESSKILMNLGICKYQLLEKDSKGIRKKHFKIKLSV